MAETNGNPNIVIGSFARINGFFPSPRTFTDAFIAAYGSKVPLPLPPRPSPIPKTKKKKKKKKKVQKVRKTERGLARARKREPKKSSRELARAREREKSE
jgi:hypothetical protein